MLAILPGLSELLLLNIFLQHMKKALLTGASGFLGKYIGQALQSQGFETTTLGRKNASLICHLESEIPAITEAPYLVVHAAGKAHVVPQTPAEEKEFFEVNLEGTRRLCQAFDLLKKWPERFVFISTVAVYGVEEGENISENHTLQGSTPYAKSKMEAEQFLKNWSHAHGVLLSILRLPLIAGANPPGNLGAMAKGIATNRYFNIGEGAARKSVVMASDVAKWIPKLAEVGGIFNLTDGQHPSFAALAALMAQQLHKKSPMSIPRWMALPMAFAGNFLGQKAPINTDKLRKITATLTFDDSKARAAFGWSPSAVLQAFKLAE